MKVRPDRRGAAKFCLGAAGDLISSGKDTPLTESSIAARLADDVESRELGRYAQTVSRCRYCQFDTSSRDQGEISLQEDFWRDVVAPLKQLDAVFA